MMTKAGATIVLSIALASGSAQAMERPQHESTITIDGQHYTVVQDGDVAEDDVDAEVWRGKTYVNDLATFREEHEHSCTAQYNRLTSDHIIDNKLLDHFVCDVAPVAPNGAASTITNDKANERLRGLAHVEDNFKGFDFIASTPDNVEKLENSAWYELVGSNSGGANRGKNVGGTEAKQPTKRQDFKSNTVYVSGAKLTVYHVNAVIPKGESIRKGGTYKWRLTNVGSARLKLRTPNGGGSKVPDHWVGTSN